MDSSGSENHPMAGPRCSRQCTSEPAIPAKAQRIDKASAMQHNPFVFLTWASALAEGTWGGLGLCTFAGGSAAAASA
jgi:hypothetical protein